MAENSKIEWTDHTFNPWIGCTKVGPGCDNCYAEHLMDHRLHRVEWGADGERSRTSAANWRKPVAWNNATGGRQRVFCASLADVFDNKVPHEWREDLWRLILRTPRLDWLLLTKRIGNAKNMLPDDWHDGYPNVWLGATVVNQEEAIRDIPKLRGLPAAVRFLSCEPLLESVNLSTSFGRGGNRIHWVIVGGESGAHARPMQLAWAQQIKNQCHNAGVAFFMKQFSTSNWPDYKDFASFPPSLQVRQFPDDDGPGTSD